VSGSVFSHRHRKETEIGAPMYAVRPLRWLVGWSWFSSHLTLQWGPITSDRNILLVARTGLITRQGLRACMLDVGSLRPWFAGSSKALRSFCTWNTQNGNGPTLDRPIWQGIAMKSSSTGPMVDPFCYRCTYYRPGKDNSITG
jgi:hypothetical protein